MFIILLSTHNVWEEVALDLHVRQTRMVLTAVKEQSQVLEPLSKSQYFAVYPRGIWQRVLPKLQDLYV